MWLKNGDHSALVSPQGGSVLQWQWREHMILGPVRVVRIGGEIKTRGESHWCYPNFGAPPPEWQGYLPKHGLLRKILFQAHFGETLQFASFTSRKPGIAGMKVDYNLGTEGLIAKLSIDHSEKGAQRVPILPALHPYFAVPIDGFWASMDHVCIARAVPWHGGYWGVSAQANVIERTGDVVVDLGGICRIALDLPDDCTHIVVWSDNPSSYVCVEPIFGEPGTFGKPEGRWLNPGERVECNIRFDFKPSR